MLNSSIYSGQIGLIENFELRVELSRWLDLVEDMNEEELVDKQLSKEFSDIAFQYIPFKTVVNELGVPVFKSKSTAPMDYCGLTSDLVVENITSNRVGIINDISYEIQKVESSLEKIMQMLEEEV